MSLTVKVLKDSLKNFRDDAIVDEDLFDIEWIKIDHENGER